MLGHGLAILALIGAFCSKDHWLRGLSVIYLAVVGLAIFIQISKGCLSPACLIIVAIYCGAVYFIKDMIESI